MKESTILADNVANNFLVRNMLLNTKGQYIKESDTLATNVTIKPLQEEV